MSTLPDLTEHTVILTERPSADERYGETQRDPNETVSYEHGGYRIHVHFGGDKTLMQCIKNLAERRKQNGFL